MPLSQKDIDAAREAVANGDGATLAGRSCLTDRDIDFAIQASKNDPDSVPAPAPASPEPDAPSGDQQPGPEKSDAWKALMKKNGPQLRKIAEDMKIEVPADAAREAIADLIVAAQEKG